MLQLLLFMILKLQAWKRVNGNNYHHFFCALSNKINNYSQITDQALKKAVMEVFTAISEEGNEIKFRRHFSRFLEDVNINPQTQKFGVYLRDTYAKRIEVKLKCNL